MRMFDLRAATRADLPQVRLLLSRYMESLLPEAVLERDGAVIDLYVVPECRGFGVAPRMLSLVARQIAAEGGTFLAGQGLTTGTQPSLLYQKIEVGCPGVDCILGGKAFWAFCELSLTSMRDFVRNLP